MKKLMVLVAMLAMMLAMAAPAFAHDVTFEGDDVEFNGVGQNILGEATQTVTQSGTATATAMAGDDAAAIAEVSQNSDVSISQSNVVGNGFFFWWWF